MPSKSKKRSKAKLSGKAVKKTRQGRQTIAEIHEDIGDIEDADARVTFGNSVTLSGVFGDYTSLETRIQIEMPVADARTQQALLDGLDKVLEPFNAKILHTIQAFQNDLLTRVGRDKIWGAKPPEGKA